METRDFFNCYQDAQRAEAYASLEIAGTYYLAYRDLPTIFEKHVQGTKALDFGCGTGRSSRFLKRLGFHVTGIDISEEMLQIARQTDPQGDYRLVKDGDFAQLDSGTYDLVLCAFPFDNIEMQKKVTLLSVLGALLNPDGKIVNLVSWPEIYLHEWASFSTRDFPENRLAKSGDVVRIIVTDHKDGRPVEDIVCSDESYGEVYRRSGLEMVAQHRPLADGTESYEWVSETTIAPWVIYVLRRGGKQGHPLGHNHTKPFSGQVSTTNSVLQQYIN